ncbi:MAG: nucleoside kinase [Christensenellales bacterium]|jgi:uridine kinase
MKITINGHSQTFSSPLVLKDAVAILAPDCLDAALAAQEGNKVVELHQPLHRSTNLEIITYQDEEGRRIYERSLRFVFLLAVKRCFPDSKVRIEHSLGGGIYIVLEGQRLYPNDVLTLKGMMEDIVAEDLPFTRHKWSKEEAIVYFLSIGDEEKARLLSFRPYDFFYVYECGCMYEYFYGAMLPSTGYLRVFDLEAMTPGLLLLLPQKNNPCKAAPYVYSPKQMATFAQSNYWCKVLECTDAADLNDLVNEQKLGEFIRVNEALHDKSLSDIADEICLRGSRTVFIAGPSSSGKTTFANRLCIQLRVNGLRPVLISLDNFYRNRSEMTLEKDGTPDLEAIDALDLEKFHDTVQSLLEGKKTDMPVFDFTNQKQNPAAYQLQIDPDQPLVIEGIHGLNPRMHQGFDLKQLFKIYISELTCLNLDPHNRIRTTDVRLLRRIVRDYQFRGTPVEGTLAMWDKVRKGEEKWIFPFQENADVMFNSALHYELPVLKKMCIPILKSLSKSDPNYLKISRLKKILNYFIPADDVALRDIPPLSILREFIGGNTLYQ